MNIHTYIYTYTQTISTILALLYFKGTRNALSMESPCRNEGALVTVR